MTPALDEARNGCTSLVALGVMAEPETLAMDEKILALSVVSSAAPMVQLIATVMEIDASAPRLAGELARELDGRLATVMVPVSHERTDELRARPKEVHRRTELPVVIQDYPAPTGVRIPVAELIDAIAGLDFIEAIKCECAPTFSRIRALRSATGGPTRGTTHPCTETRGDTRDDCQQLTARRRVGP